MQVFPDARRSAGFKAQLSTTAVALNRATKTIRRDKREDCMVTRLSSDGELFDSLFLVKIGELFSVNTNEWIQFPRML
jgi:hypothetical protein